MPDTDKITSASFPNGLPHLRSEAEVRNGRAAPSALGQWQPIETAPKDGTAFLATAERCHPVMGRRAMGVWVQDGTGYRIYPSHWMPLPDPPQATNGSGS